MLLEQNLFISIFICFLSSIMMTIWLPMILLWRRLTIRIVANVVSRSSQTFCVTPKIATNKPSLNTSIIFSESTNYSRYEIYFK
jgi:hypothetical protein